MFLRDGLWMTDMEAFSVFVVMKLIFGDEQSEEKDEEHGIGTPCFFF